MNLMNDTADAGTLEAMIDRHGLYAVTRQLAEICHGKAEHLTSNWQDNDSAKRWTKAGKLFDGVESKLHAIQS